MNNSKISRTTDRLTAVLFFIYVITLCWIILLKLGVEFSYGANRNVNWIPFRELFLYHNVDSREIILNVIIFIPLGIYTSVLFKKWNAGKKCLFVFFSSLLLEGLQYILAVGAFDITDVITNTSGGMIGLVTGWAIKKEFRDSGKAQKFVNIIAATGTIIMITLLILLKMNRLPVRYQ